MAKEKIITSILTAEDKILFKIILIISSVLAPIGFLFMAFPKEISQISFLFLIMSSIAFSITILSYEYMLHIKGYCSIEDAAKRLKTIITKRKAKSKGDKKFFEDIKKAVEDSRKEFLLDIFSSYLGTFSAVSLIVLIYHHLINPLSFKSFITIILFLYILSDIIGRVPSFFYGLKIKMKLEKQEKKIKKHVP